MAGAAAQESGMKSQQKCIAVFALMCCCAVLVVLLFSAVDIWGEEEDGITEENCSKNCRRSWFEGGVYVGIEEVQGVVGQYLFQRLLALMSRGVKLKVASDLRDSTELESLSEHGAEVRYVNMSVLTRGRLLSSFWVVDRRHIYVGSAGMDSRAFSTMKELGVIVSDCSCLALDLHRIFSFYWQLHDRDYIPSIWSKRVSALYSKNEALDFQLNATEATAYVSSSPPNFCPKDRVRDIDAIHHVINEAKKFIYISVTDYLPLINRTFQKSSSTRYWSTIDDMLREAIVLRSVRVCVLVSLWERTHPLTFNFLTSLESLCLGLANCSAQVKFFIGIGKEHRVGGSHRINHKKYMVTDNAMYIGNLDWVGSSFAYNAGIGMVIRSSQGHWADGGSVLKQAKAGFERDWHSPHTRNLQASRRIVQAFHPRTTLLPGTKT